MFIVFFCKGNVLYVNFTKSEIHKIHLQLFKKRDSSAIVFLSICEIFKYTSFYRTHPKAASEKAGLNIWENVQKVL